MRRFFRAGSAFCAAWGAYGRGGRSVQIMLVAFLGFAIQALSVAEGYAQTLGPFKDELFAYPQVLAARDGGNWRSVDYDELRDINRRDDVPERKVRRKYIDLSVNRLSRDLEFETPAGVVRFATVGRADTANLVTVFIHGRGGDRKLGMNDLRFGGNFNRIKNLMARNGGLYLVPDAGDFSQDDIIRISTLVAAHLELAPNARLVVACGSAGGKVCHALAQDPLLASRMAGIAFLGSYWVRDFLSSAAATSGVPVYIGHGSADSIFNVTELEEFYTMLRDAGVPVQMVRFETGGHGTPIRMTDWKSMINWMLSAR